MTEGHRSLIRIHLAVLLFGFSGLFARLIHLPAWTITWGRVTFASLSLMVLFLLREESLRMRTPRQTALALGAGVVLAGHWSAFFQSIQTSTVAVGTLTFATFPLFAAFLEPLIFRERLRLRDLTTASVLILGVAILVPRADLGDAMTRGILWGMLGSLSFAVLSLMNRSLVRDNRGTLVAFYEQGAAALVLTPLVLLRRDPLPLPDLALLALVGVVFTAGAHSLFIGGMRKVTARAAGVISGLEPVYAILGALVLLGETPSLRECLGGAVVLAAAAASTLRSARESGGSPSPAVSATLSPNDPKEGSP